MKMPINTKGLGLRFLFNIVNLLAKLKNALEIERVDLIVIDVFTDVYDGEMNAVNKVRTFIQPFVELAQQYECLIIFLHHTGKRTEALAPSKDNLIGSQGFEGKMRMVAELRRDPDDSNIRHLCIVKGNYIPQEFKKASYALFFDENSLTFHNTGIRTEFSKLIKQQPAENNDWKRSKELALNWYKQNNDITSREIESRLAARQLPGKKTTIAGWLHEFKVAQTDSPMPLDDIAPDDLDEADSEDLLDD